MPFMRTQFKQTGALQDIGVLGLAYNQGAIVSAGSMSTRVPTPIIMASMSSNAGSISIDALSLMNLYYGSGIFGSGYVYVPIAAAAFGSTNIGGSAFPIFGIHVLTNMVSLARSLGGASGSIGFGILNSGSTARFGVLANSAGAVPTYASAANVMVTFLLASAPSFNEYN